MLKKLLPAAMLGLVLALVSTGPVLAQPQGLPDFTGIVKEHGPAVVNVSTRQEAEKAGRIPPQFEGTPFEKFFERFLDEDRGGQHGREAQSLGSGLIISSDGYIVTNAHVIKDASKVMVRLTDRRQLEAEVVGTDKPIDVALLKVDAEDLPTAKTGDPSELEVGDWVAAIGSPFGFENSITAGIVSAKGRSLPTDNYVNFIQTDVAVNPGNSGGPLFNLDGKVVGINSQIYSKSGGFMGLSFAIPIDVVMNSVKELREYGEVRRGWLGVYIQDVSPELADSFGMDKPQGALVARVVADSPAEEAGLQTGDVVMAVDGQPVKTSDELPPRIGHLKPDDEVTLTLMRDGQRMKLDVTVGSRRQAGAGEGQQPVTALGMKLESVPDDAREELGIPGDRGAQVAEVVGHPAASARVQSGDVILKLANRAIGGPEDLRRLAEKLPSGQVVPMLVRRGQGALFIPIRIP